MDQMNMFEMTKPKFTLKGKKIKLFESFSGIGCQRMGFEKANIDYEVVGISEIDKYALKSYQAMHDELPNYGSICDIEQLPECDVFTWSFPCTDLSKIGKQKGLSKTRSGLVYEVLRILQNSDNQPTVLIMENVVDLIQIKFIREFNEIQHELENIGYTNYTQFISATDCGVPQSRDRVFMVSILGDYYYEFPKPIKLEKRLKDYLEKNVDEKYYLSEKIIEFYKQNSIDMKLKGNGFSFTPRNGNGIARTIITKSGSRMDDNYILESDNRIRKLTPNECFRLMGIDDKYYLKAKEVNSNSQLYKQAGNGIVVDVFASIVKKLVE